MNNQKKNTYKILLKEGCGEIIEKKSRFIATIRKCETEEDAISFIEEMRKKYYNASHNCFAYVVGEMAEITRYSDDNEPGGSAGRPMLDVLLGEGIRNVAVVVTRYFGGTLLGTGGLSRAYSGAVKEGLKQCEIGTMCYGFEWEILTDYNGVGKILYLLGQKKIEPHKSEYTDKVELHIYIKAEDAEILKSEMIELTSGKVHIAQGDGIYFIDKILS
ncbi:YigZ family protein [Lachnospiraceae bacterium OttesenSCG-928-D06]|nr:YigZ family protein [Lachnospiraceae bacterium OttesenSCG-928-D06]